MAFDEKTFEVIRERFGGEKGFPDLLAALLLSNPQGIDPNILPLILFMGGGIGKGRRAEILAGLAYANASQALSLAQTATGTSTTSTGTTQQAQPFTNILPMLIAFGLFGEERERELVVREAEPTEFTRAAGKK